MVTINGKHFGKFSPYVIAEIGVNHGGSLERAHRLIIQAAKAGAHAVKFQSYKAQKLAAKNYSPAYWDLSKETTGSQYELFSRYDGFTISDYRELAASAENLGVDFLSTPFDQEVAHELQPLMPATKIASADLTNLPLIRVVQEYAKPIILSTGASSEEEILSTARELSKHPSDVVFLHCVLSYPTDPTDGNLLLIQRLREILSSRFKVGYSDHIPPSDEGRMPQLEIAYLLGAVVIEKHFTDDKSAPGNDHYHAMDESDLKSFMSWIERTRPLLGSGKPELSNQQVARQNARRRIFLDADLGAGQVLREQDLIPLRSSEGIAVHEWDRILGRRLARSVRKGDPLRDGDLEAQ